VKTTVFCWRETARRRRLLTAPEAGFPQEETFTMEIYEHFHRYCHLGSTTAEVAFKPVPKQKLIRLWREARRFDQRTHVVGKHGVGQRGID
jgi:hypothetical protein